MGDKTEEAVRRILADQLCVEEGALTPKALLTEDLGMDSLDRVETVMRLEEDVLGGGQIDEEAAEGWMTVQDVLDSLTKLEAR
jgi:acyl carrier protein